MGEFEAFTACALRSLEKTSSLVFLPSLKFRYLPSEFGAVILMMCSLPVEVYIDAEYLRTSIILY
jgi:hypothetical protein